MDSLTTVTVKGRADGRVLKLKVSKSILSSLQSPNVSKDIKQLIINGLIQDQINEDGKKSPSSTETQVTTGTVGKLITKNNTPSNSETATVREPPVNTPPVNTPPVNTPPVNTTDDSFKVWKETEEKFLIDTRHQMEDAFKKKRNHGDLWKEIAEKLLDLNCKVTPNQCLYKYNALKKKWKEVIDAPSGSEAKHFRHKEEFDQFYGTKASTKPQHTIDSDNKTETEVLQDDVDDMVSKKKKKKKMRTNMKQDVCGLLEEQHTQFLDQMEKMHNEKMQKFDKFLEILSKK